jgi:hypothetical protein
VNNQLAYSFSSTSGLPALPVVDNTNNGLAKDNRSAQPAQSVL